MVHRNGLGTLTFCCAVLSFNCNLNLSLSSTVFSFEDSLNPDLAQIRNVGAGEEAKERADEAGWGCRRGWIMMRGWRDK